MIICWPWPVAGSPATSSTAPWSSRRPGRTPAWLVDGEPVGFALDPAGLGTETLHASYLHLHWAGHPHLAQRFADAVHAYAARTPTSTCGSSTVDHGDRLAEGLVDLAVNVRLPAPPDWLAAVINEATPRLGAYPRTDEAVAAIAAAHAVPPESVLPTAGGAEAFTLLARALQPDAGRSSSTPSSPSPRPPCSPPGTAPERVILTSDNGFRLDPARSPADADLVMIGNPTNPTSVLHPAATLRALLPSRAHPRGRRGVHGRRAGRAGDHDQPPRCPAWWSSGR